MRGGVTLAPMAIPSFRGFIHPLLRYLSEHSDGARIVDAYEAVADRVGLTPEDRAVLLPSGIQPLFHNRMGWAHDRLKRAGLSDSPRRGVWQLTPAGRTFAANHPNGFSEDEQYKLSYPARAAARMSKEGQPPQPTGAQTGVGPTQDLASPVERIDRAVEEINESVSDELLALIGRSPPVFFENLVLDLLHKLGYGTSRADLQRVGGTGDGGIDGIISLDRLGLEKVYVQAKRWQGVVGRPAVQGFFGALAGRRAKKGVFITTSGFTRDASEFAEQVSDSIVLVDGDRLTALMIEHGVGVSHRALKLAQVDGDYFEEA
jgi:restriction system protein